MAVLSEGSVLLQGEPGPLVDSLAGRVWRKTIPREQVDSYRAALPVLSTQLRAGRTQIQVLADVRPDTGFEPVAPDLEDVYFSTLRSQSDP